MRRRATAAPRNSAAALAALALALGLAGVTSPVATPALAQSVPPSAAIDPERASEELRRIEADLAGGRTTRAQLERLAADLGREIARLRAEMAAAADRHQRTEETVGEVEVTLASLAERAGEKHGVLAGRELELGRLLGALQRLARRPPETLLLMRRSPLDTVRTGILLEAAIPRVNAEAERLKAELAALNALETEIREQRLRLDGAAAALDHERRRLAALAAEKAELLATTPRRAAGTEQRLRELAESAGSLRALLDELEHQRSRERDEQERLAALVRPSTGNEPASPSSDSGAPPPLPRPERSAPGGTADAAAVLALLPSAPPITSAKGRLIRPAGGQLTRRFGERDPDGLRDRGLVVATRSAALVVAPYDGSVIYAGPFEGFGLILIIEHGLGYHTLLAGLGRIDLRAGQRVLAGEPVGTMPPARDGGGGGPAELYLELRHNGDPIDPLPWIAGLTGKAKG